MRNVVSSKKTRQTALMRRGTEHRRKIVNDKFRTVKYLLILTSEDMEYIKSDEESTEKRNRASFTTAAYINTK